MIISLQEGITCDCYEPDTSHYGYCHECCPYGNSKCPACYDLVVDYVDLMRGP